MENLIKRYPSLGTVSDEIKKALELIINTYENDGKLLLCGNGGSAADCDHIVGELMKSFKLKRPIDKEMALRLAEYGDDGLHLANVLERGLPAISLCEHNSLSSAYGNDRDAYAVFAQQVLGHGKSGDTLIALTTSGNSKNCVLAAIVAKSLGMNVISITGEGGGKISTLADIAIKLPEHETYLVQELTLPVYHYLCAKTEEHFFG